MFHNGHYYHNGHYGRRSVITFNEHYDHIDRYVHSAITRSARLMDQTF